MTIYYTWIVTQSCNNNCIFCTRPSDPNIPSVWKYSEEKITEQLFDDLSMIRKDYNGIILTGGEPAIRKDFIEIVKRCVDLDFERICIQTNARIFSNRQLAEKVAKIIEHRGEFYVSFHSHRKDLFNKLTGTESFNEALDGLKNLLALKMQVRTSTVVMKPNYKELPEIGNFLCSIGIKDMEFSFIHPNGMAWVNHERLIPKIEDTVPFVKKVVDVIEGKKSKATITGFPLCVLDDYKSRSPEFFISDFKTNFINSKVFWETKSKSEKCEQCRYYNQCLGIWKNYLKLFNFNFKPI